jgi:NAD(P)-dependent dehydrogenase (short-subunit alcohol dehydrogenase family)
MKDKISIITGGSRGIGRNTALNLAKRGVYVIFTYRANQAEADSLRQEIEGMGRRAVAFRLDTGDLPNRLRRTTSMERSSNPTAARPWTSSVRRAAS